MKPTWVSPKKCIPPHSISHVDKLYDFVEHMAEYGWDKFPVLIGYEYGTKIQLLSGTHRHRAALMTYQMSIPVIIWPYHTIQEAYGNLYKWKTIMKDYSL